MPYVVQGALSSATAPPISAAKSRGQLKVAGSAFRIGAFITPEASRFSDRTLQISQTTIACTDTGQTSDLSSPGGESSLKLSAKMAQYIVRTAQKESFAGYPLDITPSPFSAANFTLRKKFRNSINKYFLKKLEKHQFSEEIRRFCGTSVRNELDLN